MKLLNKSIIITGASSGIGATTAHLLAKEGANVMLAARRESLLKNLVDEIGPNSYYHVTDVTKTEDVLALINATKERFGDVDVLINNAGIGNRASLAEGDTDQWSHMIDLNIKGVLYAMRAVLPAMMAKEKGHIINLGSVASHHVYPNVSVYCATKHAVKCISEGLRLEASGKVKITMISPGAVNTEFPLHITSDQTKELKDYFEGGMQTIDIANAILYALTQPDHVDVNEVIVRPSRPTAR